MPRSKNIALWILNDWVKLYMRIDKEIHKYNKNFLNNEGIKVKSLDFLFN